TWENYTTLEYDPIVKGKRALGLVDACKKDPYAIPPVTSAQVFADAEAALKILVPDGEGADVQEYRKAVADLRKNESSYRELRETQLKKLEEMRGRWKALNEEEKAEASREYLDRVGGFFDWVKGDFASNKKKRLDSIAKEKTEFLKEFAKFEKTNGAKLQTYFRNKEMVARFAELRAFTDAYVAGKVTEKEMSTYRRMLRCESIPL